MIKQKFNISEKAVMNQKGDSQKSIEEAAKQVEQSDRDKEVRRTPEEVRIREEVAARRTKLIKRGVPKEQAREARADHLLKSSRNERVEIHRRQRTMESGTSTTL